MIPQKRSPTSLFNLSALVKSAGDRASIRFLEFFASTIRNPHTRRVYGRAVADFLAWCEDRGVPSITAVQPLHVASWIEGQTQTHAAPTVKQHLAAIRHLFDWLVTGQVITAYLKNGGTLEKAAAMANHASTRTTQLYDRRRDEMSLDEVERIRV